MTAPPKDLRRTVDIRPVRSPAQFLDLQRDFYRGDADYVPPVTFVEKAQLDARKAPFFAHADVGLFAAFRDGRCVGRISACRDRLHDEFHGDRIGFFGHFEAADEDAAMALLEHAAAFTKQRGATALRGPVDLSTNYRCGLLVEGQPGPPVMMMPHNPPHYGALIERAGLAKAKDLLALHGSKHTLDRRRIDRLAAHVQKRNGATMRRFDLTRFDAECVILWDLYQRIWERNWGFVPMTRDEFLAQARDLKQVAHQDLMHIAEIGGEPVGFVVAVPDTNVGARACNGRLFPFGWWKFLQAMKKVTLIRVLTLGVVREHRRSGLDLMLMHRVISDGIDAGFDACEASWILEDNRDMLGPLETIGLTPYRRYRIYEKTLL
jgi:GNAT superfamily N-acetyltransferase